MATIRVLPTHKADSKQEGLALTRTEFKAMLNDTTKRIEGDIVWQEDEDRSPCLEFRAEIEQGMGAHSRASAASDSLIGGLVRKQS